MICRYCGNDQNEDRFQIAKVVNGKVYRRKKCTTCKIGDRDKRAAINAEWVRNYKSMHGCYICGMKDFRALQLHHEDSDTKEGNISDMVIHGFSIKRIQAEIAKCKVICANCHQILHYNERNI